MKRNELVRLRAGERTMILVRWCAALFALVQVLTYYRPYPGRLMVVALALVGLLAAGNAVIWLWSRRLPLASTKKLVLGTLAFDVSIVFAFVAVYTFDPNTAIWALIYILPLEGAIRFQRRGALATMTAATCAYTIREAYGSFTYGYEFLPTSISFRMGIGFIIAAVAGAMSSRLLRERDRVASMHETSRSLASSLDEGQVLEALARSACHAVGGRFAIVFEAEEEGLRSVASHRAPPGYGQHLVHAFVAPSLELTPAVLALRESRIVWAEDVARDFAGENVLGHLAKTAADVGFGSLVVVPVTATPNGQGRVLVVYFDGARTPDREQEQFLQDLTEAAATPLTHATAYGRERDAARELRELHELRSQLLAMVAHDLRTPLTVIKGIARTLGSFRDSSDRQNELLDIVDHQVERVDRLVTDLLDLARLEAGRLEIIPERLRLLPAIQAALRGLPGAGEVVLQVPVEVEVVADPRRLSQVVINLVSNALRHGAPPVRVVAERRDHEVSLEVSDCGQGLPASRRDRTFEAFVPGETEGSIGLGLAIVRGLIEAHAGRVSYEDNEPRGARFVCTLPAPPARGAPP